MKQETIQKLHSCMLEILIEIDRLCKEHSLTYFLIGGTLLGAVRHKGFIPWDDDLDIVMPREDYIRFEELCRTELKPAFYLHCIETDSGYPMPMPKMKLKNTVFEQETHVHSSMHKEIWVDIFPLDNARKESSLFQTIQAKLQGALGAVRGAALGIYDTSRFSVLNKALFLLLHNIPNQTLARWQTKIQMWNQRQDSGYFVNFSSGYGYRKQTIKKSVYYPGCLLEFEGRRFPAPSDWHYFLCRIYGENYMRLPPMEKRVTHNPVRLSFDTHGPDEDLEDSLEPMKDIRDE